MLLKIKYVFILGIMSVVDVTWTLKSFLYCVKIVKKSHVSFEHRSMVINKLVIETSSQNILGMKKKADFLVHEIKFEHVLVFMKEFLIRYNSIIVLIVM